MIYKPRWIPVAVLTQEIKEHDYESDSLTLTRNLPYTQWATVLANDQKLKLPA